MVTTISRGFCGLNGTYGYTVPSGSATSTLPTVVTVGGTCQDGATIHTMGIMNSTETIRTVAKTKNGISTKGVAALACTRSGHIPTKSVYVPSITRLYGGTVVSTCRGSGATSTQVLSTSVGTNGTLADSISVNVDRYKGLTAVAHAAVTISATSDSAEKGSTIRAHTETGLTT